MAGWIKIYQSIREHWIWERPIYIKWWLDLLMLAEWRDRKRTVGSSVCIIKRGQLIASVRFLRERWQYRNSDDEPMQTPSPKTVMKFLGMLERDGMINRDTEKLPNRVTLITICNYDIYQSNSDVVNNTNGNTTGNTDGNTTGNTKGNEYEDIIDVVDVEEITDKGEIKISPTISKKGDGSKKFIPPTVAEVQALIDEKGYHFDAEAFVAFYESKGWMVGKSKMKKWQSAAVTWEKRTHQNQNNNGRIYNTRQSDAAASRQQRGAEYANHIASILNSDTAGEDVH